MPRRSFGLAHIRRFPPIGRVEWRTDDMPSPGCTYTCSTWPPRGRGRGESLTSPRRVEARLRILDVIHLRGDGYTWQQIARALGYKDASGPYRAFQRTLQRMYIAERRKAYARRYR